MTVGGVYSRTHVSTNRQQACCAELPAYLHVGLHRQVSRMLAAYVRTSCQPVLVETGRDSGAALVANCQHVMHVARVSHSR